HYVFEVTLSHRCKLSENRKHIVATVSAVNVLLSYRKSGDLGRDIIVEIFGMKFVVQCKAWYSKDIGRDKIDEFRTVVRDGKYAFGVSVGALEEKFAIGAYKSAERSESDIIITVYNRMCQDIE
ncbi:5097_t:CDS:2, partial [Scutellospora calospora]